MQKKKSLKIIGITIFKYTNLWDTHVSFAFFFFFFLFFNGGLTTQSLRVSQFWALIHQHNSCHNRTLISAKIK